MILEIILIVEVLIIIGLTIWIARIKGRVHDLDQSIQDINVLMGRSLPPKKRQKPVVEEEDDYW